MSNIKADCAEWYFKKDPEEEIYYEFFFRLCKKYNINWAKADDKEKAFIEEITRVSYERDNYYIDYFVSALYVQIICEFEVLLPILGQTSLRKAKRNA